jgi:predicted ester cyclase
MLVDNAPPSEPAGNLPGFDPEFSDIVDYILRITYRIWEGKQVGLCQRYYSEDCPVYTLAGYSEGAEEVARNTLMTLGAFPDRTLHADNIIWSGDAVEGFHTSHLISTNMTHLGDSEHGPATGLAAKIQVIAHCVVRGNRIVEEWLVRDNWALAEQLCCDPWKLAAKLAQKPLDPESRYGEWLDTEWERVQGTDRTPHAALPTEGSHEQIEAMLHNIWNARLPGDCRSLYAENALMHASAHGDVDGVGAIERFYLKIMSALPDARISIDHACTESMLSGDYVALRWTVAGTHLGGSLWGAASDAPVLILGESQYRLKDGMIVEEWFVFDQVAVVTQIERARIAAGETRAGEGVAPSPDVVAAGAPGETPGETPGEAP